MEVGEGMMSSPSASTTTTGPGPEERSVLERLKRLEIQYALLQGFVHKLFGRNFEEFCEQDAAVSPTLRSGNGNSSSSVTVNAKVIVAERIEDFQDSTSEEIKGLEKNQVQGMDDAEVENCDFETEGVHHAPDPLMNPFTDAADEEEKLGEASGPSSSPQNGLPAADDNRSPVAFENVGVISQLDVEGTSEGDSDMLFIQEEVDIEENHGFFNFQQEEVEPMFEEEKDRKYALTILDQKAVVTSASTLNSANTDTNENDFSTEVGDSSSSVDNNLVPDSSQKSSSVSTDRKRGRRRKESAVDGSKEKSDDSEESEYQCSEDVDSDSTSTDSEWEPTPRIQKRRRREGSSRKIANYNTPEWAKQRSVNISVGMRMMAAKNVEERIERRKLKVLPPAPKLAVAEKTEREKRAIIVEALPKVINGVYFRLLAVQLDRGNNFLRDTKSKCCICATQSKDVQVTDIGNSSCNLDAHLKMRHPAIYRHYEKHKFVIDLATETLRQAVASENRAETVRLSSYLRKVCGLGYRANPNNQRPTTSTARPM